MNIHYLELIFPALVIMISAAVFLTRYKRCPKDKILVIWGALLGGGGERSSKCIHGGGAFVWPLVQDFSYLSLEPLNIEIQAMTITSDNKYVDVSMDFSVQISLEEEVMYNAADCLLNQSSDAIKDMARHIILGHLRLYIASASIGELGDTENFKKAVHGIIDGELRNIGLCVTDIRINNLSEITR